MQYIFGLAGIGAAVLLGSIAYFKFFKGTKAGASSKRKQNVALKEENVKYPFELVFKEVLTSDTRRFRFALPSKEQVLGLPVGKHIYLSATINGELIVRPYTPTSSDKDKGYFDLVIKVYKAGVHPKFPDGGKMSQYLDSLNVGDKIDVRGPSGRLVYKGKGTFEITADRRSPPKVKKVKRVGMIAGGTGITPMFQIMREICENPDDNTKIQLLFANQTPNDILLKDVLEKFQEEYKDRVSVWYTVDRTDEPWSYDVGFVNEKMILGHLPPAGDDTLILMCGPPPMINFACVQNLDKLGYTAEMRYAF